VTQDLPAEKLAELRGTGTVFIAEDFEDVHVPSPPPPFEPPSLPTGNWVVPYTAPLGEDTEREWVPADPRFYGHWEGTIDGHPAHFEQGPGWNDVEDAIAWGRARTSRVLVRLGLGDPKHYSAGEERLTDPKTTVLPWPPEESG
jgi:hypothetical protein